MGKFKDLKRSIHWFGLVEMGEGGVCNVCPTLHGRAFMALEQSKSKKKKLYLVGAHRADKNKHGGEGYRHEEPEMNEWEEAMPGSLGDTI